MDPLPLNRPKRSLKVAPNPFFFLVSVSGSAHYLDDRRDVKETGRKTI